jgi:hypothetical protein
MASIEIVSGLVLMASAGNVSLQDHQAFVAAHEHCRAEVQQLCVAIPADTLLGCLQAHGSQLSPTCRSALADLRTRRSAQSAN